MATCKESVSRLPREEEMDKSTVRQPQPWERQVKRPLPLILAQQSFFCYLSPVITLLSVFYTAFWRAFRLLDLYLRIRRTALDILNQLGIRCGHDFDEPDYKYSVLSTAHSQVRSVYIQHLNSGANQYIRTCNKNGDRKLVVDGLQRDSELFKFQVSKYTGRHFANIDTVIEVSHNLCGQRQCMSASNDKNVRLQPKKSLSARVKELDSDDSRFFILKPAGTHSSLESTKCPDHFLACKYSKMFLKHIPKANENKLEDDPDVVFEFRDVNPSSR